MSTTDKNSIAKKWAIVTGASRGIGAAIRDELLSRGYSVIGTATSDSSLESMKQAVADSFDANTVTFSGSVLNLTDQDSINAFFQQLKSESIQPLVLVNNAGITRDNLVLRMNLDDWQQVMQTNLTGAFQLSKFCIKSMIKQRWGRIINISSVVAQMANPGQANYVASKSGVEGLTRSLAYEVAPRGVTVNAIAPGFIVSDMTKQLTDQQKDLILGQIPMKRMGDPADVAKLVSFIASDEASYITGQTIQVNGGLYS